MTDIAWLDRNTFDSVLEALRTSRICRDRKDREALWIGIPAGHVAEFRAEPAPGQTLLALLQDDLNHLNQQDSIEPGVVPLQIWLLNALRDCKRAGLRQQNTFAAALQKLGAVWKGEQESLKIPDRPDYVPYLWYSTLTGDIGPNVGYIEVPVYYNGEAWLGADGLQALGGGTGWLIGDRYLITNHHVINARNDGDPDATDSDLRLQAASSRVYFDYIEPKNKGKASNVEDLCIFQSRYAQPYSLDYAVLRLAEMPGGKQPLPIARALDGLGGKDLPANIVQHPLRKAKQVAVRNNRLRSWDDRYLYYETDTEPGSSGSPVCDDLWHVVGLHRAGHNDQGLNVGIRIDCIMDDLKQRDPALWSEMNAQLV